MTIQKDFILRYRSPGHIRFQIPKQACQPDIANILEERLLAVEGVRTAQVFAKQGKLSIRYNEATLPFIELAKCLHKLLQAIEQEGLLHGKMDNKQRFRVQLKTRISDKIQTLTAGRWFKEKYADAKETVQAAKIITRVGMKGPKALIKDPERAIVNVLNDILIVYLVKTHWRRIVKEWLPNPIKHRYEWVAASYLLFTLLRSRAIK